MKSNSEAIEGPVRRLVRCCRVLGIWNGYRYWRLQNRAMRDPEMVPKWATCLRAEADEDEAKGNHLSAGVLRAFATDAEATNRKFHPPKEIRYTGHVLCRHCGKVHWMYANCPPNASMQAPATSGAVEPQQES